MANITRTTIYCDATYDMVTKSSKGLENLTGLVRERIEADTRAKVEAVLEKENKGSLVMLTACRFYSETLTLPEEVYRKYATVWKTEELDEKTLLEKSEHRKRTK